MTKKTSDLPLHTVIVYSIIGYLWIFLSDLILSLITSESTMINTFQTYKGFLFVTVTAIILYIMLKQRLLVIEKERSERIQSENKLSESEERFSKFFYANPVAIIITRNNDGKIIEVNQSYQALLEYSREELVGNTVFDLTIIQRLNKSVSTSDHETTLKTKSGKLLVAICSVDRIELNGEECLLSSYLNITDRKRAEEEIAKLNRSNRVMADINQLIVRSKEIDTVFREACSIAVNNGKFVMAWIGIKNDTTNTLDVIAHAGITEDYLKKINIDFRDTTRSGGPTGLTVRKGIHHFTADIETDPTMALWRTDALQLGFKSSAAFPLTIKGKVVGAFTLYAGEKNFFTADELELLDELAMDISFAMEVNRIEVERQKIDVALHESENRYRTIVEWTPEPTCVVRSGKFIYVNPAIVKMFGSTSEEDLVGTSILDRVHPDFKNIMLTRLEKITDHVEDDPILQERLLKMDGTIIDVEVLGTPIVYDGEPAIHVSMHDITQLKQAEMMIQQSERLLKESQQVSRIGSYTLDIHNGVWKGSDVLNELFGISADDDHSIQGWLSVIHPNDQQMMLEYFSNDVLGKCLRFDKQYRIIAIDSKTERWVHVIGELEIDADGHPITLIGTIQDITDRKWAEETLRESEERLRLSLKATNQGMYDLNIQTGETIVNAEYATMLGYDPSTFVETNAFWVERLHPDDKGRTSQVYSDYIAGTLNEYRVEFRQRTSSGSWKWILSIGKIIDFTDDGKPLRMLGTHTDIDDMKRAEEMQLLQTTALESAANGIIITDLEGHIVWTNTSFTRITGYSDHEVIGANPNLLKSGKHPKEFYEQMWKTIKSGSIWNGMVINKKKDGTFYDDEMTITPVRNNKNIITHFVAVKQDVTERNKAMKQIEEQAMFLNEAHEAIIVRDMNYSVLYWNKGAERLFGWNTEEAMGKDVRTMVYREGIDYSKQMDQLFRDGNYSGEFQLRTKENHAIDVNVRLNMINDAEGRPKSILSMNNDITEKKKIEAQFLRTQRMGSLGTLAGGIAHDLNNVLAPILLAVEYLKRTYVNANSQKILESVESSTRRGAEIVKQILTFARGMETQKILIQPRHLIKEIVGIFKETFPRSITIKSDIPNSISTIMGDPTHFHQLIMNLGVNARDAMPDGGTLSITASNEMIDDQYVRMNIDAKVGHYVMFSIKDTGMGMSPQVLDHVFEPFFTTKEIGKGTGLGLSTVYTIVKSHQGFIKVQSEVGKGTTFNIFLPASDSTLMPSEEKNEIFDLIGNGELILVVDDEKSIREVTKETLESYNYTVITASDGAEGVARFAEQRQTVALVLTDMMMPIMDGHHLIITLRKMDPNVKIIASSGLIDKPKISGSNQKAVNGFIDKPYTAEKLLRLISDVLKEK